MNMIQDLTAKFHALKLSKVVIADIQILGSAFFFGIGFLGQRAVMVHGLGPMTCNAFRFALSTILLVACLPLIPSEEPSGSESDEDSSGSDDDETKQKEIAEASKLHPHSHHSSKAVIIKLLGPYATNVAFIKRTVWFWGVLLGLINFCASGYQQWGISLTSASKCAFIAGFDLFLTPIFSLFIPTFKQNAKPSPSTWVAVGTAMMGLFLLSGAQLDDMEMGLGESLTIVSTVFWTLHITYTDIATSYVDSISMMCVQLAVVTVLSASAALILEPQQWLWDHIYVFLPWLIFLAISEGLGFTLMAVGQTFSPPTHAAIILSLEGVFASAASYVILGEHLSLRELGGCFLMLTSTLIAKVGCPCEHTINIAADLDGGLGRGSNHGHLKSDIELALPKRVVSTFYDHEHLNALYRSVFITLVLCLHELH